MIEITETSLAPWGKCLKITNGSIELFATLDFGPRIIRFGRIGGKNIMFEDIDDEVNKKANEAIFAEKFGADKGVWHIRGGHRLWTSPEYLPRTYYPDNETVEYKKTENGAILIPPEQKWTNLQYEIEISMCSGEDKVCLNHKITNNAPFASEFAPWALTVLTKGGKEIVPQPTKDTGLLGNRLLALWPYTKMTDKRVFWGDRYITLKQDPQADCAFKIGINSQHGWAAYQIFGDMFVKYFEPKEDGIYPDGGMSFETYTSEHIMEMETLGELKTVMPGETVCHSETWKYIKDVAVSSDNEEEIDGLVKKYIQ